MKPKGVLFIILLFSLLGVSCKSEENISATIAFIKGKVTVVSGEKKEEAKIGYKLSKGDKVLTAANSVAILNFDDGSASIELQANAEFVINDYTKTKKDLHLAKGNAWSRVQSLDDAHFTLSTPTTVAGVRGTKFYTFSFGDIQGTCFCEGTVDYHVNTSNFSGENPEDYIVFTKGDKTVIVTQKDLAEAGIHDPSHNHSVLDSSPLGKKYSLSEEEEKIFFDVMRKKFEEASE